MTPANVLIVEDDRIVARDLSRQLSQMGHTVVGVTGKGEEAVAMAHRAHPQVVLMDIRLDGQLDGIEAAQQIRERLEIPVIFLTAYADDETLGRASSAQAFGFLLKPFENSQLRTTVEITLNKHKAEKRRHRLERYHAATLSSIGDGVISTDTSGRVRLLNKAAQELTGWRNGVAVGRSIKDVFRTFDDRGAPTALNRGDVIRAPRGMAAEHVVLVGRDGRKLPVELLCSPIMEEDELAGFVLIFRGLTSGRDNKEPRRTSHDAVAHTSGLARVGELAVSLSHEINQPLAAIVANAGAGLNFLRHPQPDLEELRMILTDVIADGTRAGNVIRALRGLASEARSDPTHLEMRQVIQNVLESGRA